MAKKPKKDELITLSQAAEISGFTVAYLQDVAARRRLNARKIGVQWFTTPGNLDVFIKSRKKRGIFREDI